MSVDAHVEDMELSNHEACPNDMHHGHDHAHSEHECSSDTKITGTQNKILQGEVITIMFNFVYYLYNFSVIGFLMHLVFNLGLVYAGICYKVAQCGFVACYKVALMCGHWRGPYSVIHLIFKM